jgi:hypothetical protein
LKHQIVPQEMQKVGPSLVVEDILGISLLNKQAVSAIAPAYFPVCRQSQNSFSLQVVWRPWVLLR